MTKIAYCAGHGRFTPGKRTPDDEREWTFNDKVIRAMETELKTYEGVQLLRTDDPTGGTDVPLKTRTNKANNWGADVYVSVHHNANTGRWGNWTGVETFTYLGSNPKSERLAKCVHPRIVQAMGLRDRGMKKENLHIVRETKMPAILTEGGYMDSTIDILKLRSDAHMKAQGVAIAQGIAEYAGLKKNSGTTAAAKNYMDQGDQGDKVKELQQNLITLGLELEADGIYGKDTANAVMTLQRRTGLDADGIAGTETLAKIKVLLERDAKASTPGTYRVYTGVFSSEEEAQKQADAISGKLGYQPFVKERRVWTGAFNSLESAMSAQQNISREFGFNPQIRKED